MEAWHLRHRAAALKAATKEHSRLAFQQVLGNLSNKHVDGFAIRTRATLLSVEPGTSHAQLTHDFEVKDGDNWFLDDVPAKVHRVSPYVLRITSDLLLCPGQEVLHVRPVGNTEEMLQMLHDYWSQRWNKDVLPTDSDWRRILSFVMAYVPPVPFAVPPVTLTQWEDINLRYNDRSASGPDSFDHLDLQRMPRPMAQGLVSLLNGIEEGADWPSQLSEGFGICLPKHDRALEVGEFRPIIVFSMIYRSWTALRSRMCLRQLASVTGVGVTGFMPSREAGEIWHFVQALVEVSLQQGGKLSGVITDVRKAFESVPRDLLFVVARQLGLPMRLIDPWRRFLASCSRRFQLHGHSGTSITSNHGLPEGDGLSVLGMSIVDHLWDVYQSVFAPATIPISYVDNDELLSKQCSSLLTGFGVLETFMSLWHLELDAGKTLFWSTDPADRNSLRRLGRTVCLETADLGGALTFCKRTGPGVQMARVDALDQLWGRLRRAHLVSAVKAFLLRQAFWSKAFHAVGISLLPWRVIQSLRTKAVKALGFGKAGAHPGLRLSLLTTDMATDPGYYQIKKVFMDFRRFLRKQPSSACMERFLPQL